MKRIITITLIIHASFFSGALHSRSIWRDRNIYSSENAIRVGDILIITINDISRMRFNLNINSQTTSDISSNPDVTITGFLPRVSGNRNTTYRNTTAVSQRGQINLSIAATVVSRGAGRSYAVTGTRVYSFNGTSNSITVTGQVDPRLVNGRSIDSVHIANFRLEVRGRGEGIKITRPPLKENETAKSTLTEEEKQQIITDYLQKMLSELSK